MYYTWLLMLMAVFVGVQPSRAAEPVVAGDDALRLAVLDALASHEADVRSGHWIGEITLQSGCVKKLYTNEHTGALELIWDKDHTWAQYTIQEVSRVGAYPSSPTYNHRLFVRDGVIAVHWLDMGIVYVTLPTQERMGHVLKAIRMRPDERWFHYEGYTKWSEYLTVPSAFPEVNLVRSESVRLPDGLIRIRQEYDTNVQVEVFADENQGLNLVKWERTWNDWHHVGSASWKQTPEGVWYPEKIEYSSAKPPCLHLPERFVLQTTSFESNPKIDPKLFDWRAGLPVGTRYEIGRADGRKVEEGLIGKAKAETAQEILDRLAKEAESGFAIPPEM